MGSTDIKDSRSQLIAAFLEVMQCSDMEAEFYLESSNMDIATAISLCMDSREEVDRDLKQRSGGKRHRSFGDDPGYAVKYTGKQVMMAGINICIFYSSRHRLSSHPRILSSHRPSPRLVGCS
jgi:hypothetical protein